MPFVGRSALSPDQKIKLLEKENAALKVELEKRQSLEIRISNLETAYVAMRSDLQYAFQEFQKNTIQVVGDQLLTHAKDTMAKYLKEKPDVLQRILGR